MFIGQVYKYNHNFGRYILGSFLVIIGIIAGQIPLAIAVFLKRGYEIETMNESELLQALNPNLSLFLMLLTFAVGLVVLLLVVKLLHQQSFTSLTTSRKKIDWQRFRFAFSLVAAYTVIVTLLDYWANPEDYLVNFQPIPFLILCVVAVVMIPLQTSWEEYFFRGYLMQGLGILAKYRWVPLILTSLTFGGLHFFNPEVTKLGNIIMIYYIGTGFMLGIMTLMDEGLELALGFHAANNVVTALLVTADWTAFQTHSIFKDVSEPSVGWDVLIPILFIYPVFLYIMSRKYQWKNWNKKLFGKVEKPKTVNLPE